MNEHLRDIDKLFHDSLDGHVENPPPSVWEEVSRDLDKKQAIHYREKYNRLRRAALVLFILVIIGIMSVFYYTSHKQINNVSQRSTATSSTTNLRSKQQSRVTTSDKSTPAGKAIPSTENTSLPPVGDPVDTHTTAIDKDESNDTVDAMQREGVVQKSTTKILPDRFAADAAITANNKQPGQTQRKNSAVLKTRLNEATDQSLPYPLPFITSLDVLQLYSVSPVTAKQLTGRELNHVIPTKITLSKDKAASQRGFSLTAFGAPNISFDHLEDDHHLSRPDRNRNRARYEEKLSSSFSAGLLLNYSINPKITLQSGIIFTSSSTAISPKTIYAKADNNGRMRYELHCSSGYSYITSKGSSQPAAGDSIKTTGVTSKLNYISIPVSISTTIQKGKFSLHPSLGVAANILTSGKTRTSLLKTSGAEKAVTPISGLKSAYMEGRIGLGTEYELTKQLSVALRPTARLALSSINQKTPVKSYQNFLSLETGISIRF